MYQIDNHIIKVFCKESYEIVAGELFTEGKWYEGEDYLENDEPYYEIKGNTLITDCKNYFDDNSPLIIDSWDFYLNNKTKYFNFDNFFYTEEEYKNK